METWPPSFPPPDVSFSAEGAANAIRTDIDAGPTRQRRRFSAEVVSVGIQWTLSDREFGVFLGYHKWKLNLGSDWFVMNLNLGGGAADTVVRFQNGNYKQSYQDVGFWTVTATLDVQERVVMSAAVLETYLDGGGFSDGDVAGLIGNVIAFHTLVHTTLPTNLN